MSYLTSQVGQEQRVFRKREERLVSLFIKNYWLVGILGDGT